MGKSQVFTFFKGHRHKLYLHLQNVSNADFSMVSYIIACHLFLFVEVYLYDVCHQEGVICLVAFVGFVITRK